jgi:copper(I)-binding protein
MMLGSILLTLAAQGVTLTRPIVRAAPAGEDAAAYVAIANHGAADRLVEVGCGCAESVEIHRVVRSATQVSMTRAPSLAVPAGGVEVRPGSDLHLMLIGLRAPLAEGARVPLTLRFERAGALTAAFAAVGDTGAAWSAAVQAEPPVVSARLQPLARVVGSCWRGTFPDGRQTDTHCFTAIYGGAFVRDVHVVENAPGPYSGETLYRWDGEAGQIVYDYYASDGSHSDGSASAAPNGVAFPQQAHRGPGGATTMIRSSWTFDGPDAYVVLAERLQGETWHKLWEMRMVRVGPAPPR